MKVLVLSCSTGGGHNKAAYNIVECLQSHGILATYQNYLELFDKTSQKFVEEFYYKSIHGNGHFFKGIYKLGELYNKTKFTSPVYILNKHGKEKLKELIAKESVDLCICTHLYPALALTELKKEIEIHLVFVGTDYKCIPFTNEVNPDYFIIPHKDMTEDYEKMHISKEKLIPLGIPAFYTNFSKEELLKKLEIQYSKNILLMSGSMGFGNITKVVQELLKEMNKETGLIVICGSNQKLYEELILNKEERLKVLGFIDNVLEYIFISNIVLTKPGGLSTTEVAIYRKPFLHICPIPGVEMYNAKYFSKKEMALLEMDIKKIAPLAIHLLNNVTLQKKLVENLKEINQNALEDLYQFIINHYKN